VDCAGVCGGKAEVDKCGVCAGGGKDVGCDGKCFSGAVKDCNGKCGGKSLPDDCGVCGGNNKDKGCDGVCFSGLAEDCTGVCGGPNKPDSCGVCGGGDRDKGCDGVCFSKKTKDCKGVCGGKNHADSCGVCGGGDKDKGCDGVCFSNKVKDCAGACGGAAAPDDCGVCDGENRDKDCAGICFGKSYLDAYGSCIRGAGSAASSAFGSASGSAYASSASSNSASHAANSASHSAQRSSSSFFSSSSASGAASTVAGQCAPPVEPSCGAPAAPSCGAPAAPVCGAPAAPVCGAPAGPACGCAQPVPGVVQHEQIGPSWWVQVLLRVSFITLLGGAVGTAVIRHLLGPRLGGEAAPTLSYVKESWPPAERNLRSWMARRRAVRALCVITASAAVSPNADTPKAALAALVRLASPGSRASVYLVFVCGGVEAATSIMAVCRANAAVMTNVCTLIHQLASTPSTVVRIRHHADVSSGKLPLAILSVIRLFASEARCCEAAAAALWSLAFGSGAFVQSTLVRGGAHLDLMACIVRHPSDVPVLYRACGALMSLALRNPEAQRTLGESGAAHLLMETLTARRELNYGGDFSELRVWMRKYAAEKPRPMLEGGAGAGGDEGAAAASRWWDIVRDQGPLPDTAFRTITLPKGGA